MIASFHIEFTKHIIKNCGLSEDYVLWSNLPDIDLTNNHRYTWHRLSQFNKLYQKGITEYKLPALDKKIVDMVLLGHLYLDMLQGPVKVFNGINITCSKRLFQNFQKYGIQQTIDKVYDSIHIDNRDNVDYFIDCLKLIDISSVDILKSLFYLRLTEETINLSELNIQQYKYKYYSNFREIDVIYAYCRLIKFEREIDFFD